jgi:hypothetical protein
VEAVFADLPDEVAKTGEFGDTRLDAGDLRLMSELVADGYERDGL